MNNKEFIQQMSKRLSLSQSQVSEMIDAYCDVLVSELQENEQVSFISMGTLEVKKKEQRILVNPGSQQRMLVPPKLVLGFKASSSLRLFLKQFSK